MHACMHAHIHVRNVTSLFGAGDAPFPYNGAEGVHACEILLGEFAPPGSNLSHAVLVSLT